MVALEAGWIVTEAGRQPWAIYRVMRTAAAVTPARHVSETLGAFALLYIGLAFALVLLLTNLANAPVGETAASAVQQH